MSVTSDLRDHPLMRDLRRIVQKLALVSHAPIQGYNFAPNKSANTGGWRLSDSRVPVPHLGGHQSRGGDSTIPRGNIDWVGDHTLEYRQKSAEYFQDRIARLLEREASTANDLRVLVAEAEAALEAWQKTPLLDGQRPHVSDPRWKQWIADSDEDGGTLSRWFGVSRQYIHQVRKAYRDDAN